MIGSIPSQVAEAAKPAYATLSVALISPFHLFGFACLACPTDEWSLKKWRNLEISERSSRRSSIDRITKALNWKKKLVSGV